MLKPKSLALALVAALYCTTRIKLTVAERRAGRWEGRFVTEEGRRVEVEAELARALDRLGEVVGALQGCEARQRQREQGWGQGQRLWENAAAAAAAAHNNGHDTERPAAASLNYCTTTTRRGRNNDNNNGEYDDEDNNRRRQEGRSRGGSSDHNNNHNNNDDGGTEQAATDLCKGAGSGVTPPSLTLLDNCYLSMHVGGGPCSEEALQALTEGLGGVMAQGEKTVREVVQGTVGLAQELMGSLGGWIDDAAAAASSLSLDALADVLGVGGVGEAWFEEGWEEEERERAEAAQ
jgi:hypothetical protein